MTWNAPHRTIHRIKFVTKESVGADMDGTWSPIPGKVAHSTIEVACKMAKGAIADFKS
jgi:hypothetical protein